MVVRETLSSAASDASVARRRGNGLMICEVTGHFSAEPFFGDYA